MHRQQPRPTPAPATPSAVTAIDARRLAADMVEVMNALLNVIERETELVRAGKVAEAMALETSKIELSRRYVSAVSTLKTHQVHLRAVAPELLTTLQRHHDTFRALLQVNLTVLATAHAVSEGIVRGVNVEVQRRNIPQTYTATGHRASPSGRHITPIAISRSM